ncbi:DUF397 domain-containing protein [Catellatospora citrea]|uniref:DUF397 domain-containing protein n=1 Tax=Catellatospora citrea TaxID=53366 RepID=A0A8J3KUC4_9ACTN|nr:DUF397 domain-containing protein [Catellatospora citrea]RKE07909.1 uncharacterized protein DUF397 [Catellatospora citrea]GIG02080.1 hypothetical protein Cci01nite_71730 [Catellatospora citrea]
MSDRQFGPWRKSIRSGGADNCVEVATATDEHIGVRDSKSPNEGVLVFGPEAWSDFVEGVRRGEFDL